MFNVMSTIWTEFKKVTVPIEPKPNFKKALNWIKIQTKKSQMVETLEKENFFLEFHSFWNMNLFSMNFLVPRKLCVVDLELYWCLRFLINSVLSCTGLLHYVL